MASSIITIKLSEIQGEALDYVEEAGPCEDKDLRQVVEQVGRRLYIVDGFHRTAGQIRHCREAGIDPASYEIQVILSDDDELMSVAAMPGPDQAAALEKIYKQAGL